MDQMNREFVPHVLVVPVGSQRDLPQQRYGEPPGLFVFAGQEIPVPAVSRQPESARGFRSRRRRDHRLQHPRPDARLCVRGGWRSTTDAPMPMGTWTAGRCGAGDYTVQVWHPLAREMRPIIEQQVACRLTVPAARADAAHRHATATASGIDSACQLGRVLMRTRAAHCTSLWPPCCLLPLAHAHAEIEASLDLRLVDSNGRNQLHRRRLGQAALRCR